MTAQQAQLRRKILSLRPRYFIFGLFLQSIQSFCERIDDARPVRGINRIAEGRELRDCLRIQVPFVSSMAWTLAIACCRSYVPTLNMLVSIQQRKVTVAIKYSQTDI
jgi:hypothetical protein